MSTFSKLLKKLFPDSHTQITFLEGNALLKKLTDDINSNYPEIKAIKYDYKNGSMMQISIQNADYLHQHQFSDFRNCLQDLTHLKGSVDVSCAFVGPGSDVIMRLHTDFIESDTKLKLTKANLYDRFNVEKLKDYKECARCFQDNAEQINSLITEMKHANEVAKSKHLISLEDMAEIARKSAERGVAIAPKTQGTELQ